MSRLGFRVSMRQPTPRPAPKGKLPFFPFAVALAVCGTVLAITVEVLRG